MGSSIGQAKVRPVSWDAFEKVEPFTEAVRKQLSIMKARRGVRVLPKTPLPEATLDRVIMCIWCVCYCGMQWRTVCRLAGLPFGTVYSCFARWQRLGLWKALMLDLLRSWRLACGDNPKPSVVVVDSRSCRSAPTCGKRGIDGGKKVKGIDRGSPAIDDQSRGRQAWLPARRDHLQGQRPRHGRHCPGPARSLGRWLPRQGPGRPVLQARKAPGDRPRPRHRG